MRDGLGNVAIVPIDTTGPLSCLHPVVPVPEEQCQQAARTGRLPAVNSLKADHLMTHSEIDLSGLLRLWDASCQPNGPAQPPSQPGFSGANVWRIETARGPLAVRGWPHPGLPRRRIEGLHQLLDHVGASVPVAIPIPTSNGDRLARWNEQLWQLEPWMPGVADFHDNPSPERLSEAIKTLASFHRSAREFVPGDETREWFGSSDSRKSPAVTERLGQLDGWGHRWNELVTRALRVTGPAEECSRAIEEIDNLFRRGRSWIGDQLAMVETTTFRGQPCLRDVWHDHLLWTGDHVTGLIDPGSCRIDNVAIDLARLLGSLVEDDVDGWELGLSTYEREAGLSLEETSLVTVLDQSGVMMAGAVWIERLATGRVETGWATRIGRKLAEVARRMRALSGRVGLE